MKLHFLVSISSQTESLYGVRFLSSFLGKVRDCEVTLFHICDQRKDGSQVSLMSLWENPDKSADVHLNASSRKAITQSKKIVESSGILGKPVKTITMRECFGRVKDILGEGSNGLYDAVVLGRRATYALQWMFDKPADEIHQAMVRDASLSSPLWICSEPEEGRNNVLLCLDGSSSALRMADHVGFILSFATHHQITLFHVKESNSGDTKALFVEGRNILSKHGISSIRIKEKTVRGMSVTNTIMAEKSSGKYAVIAVGLNGKSKTKMLEQQKVVGKTTSTLITKISKASLWCCP